jgi:hypothetical protein
MKEKWNIFKSINKMISIYNFIILRLKKILLPLFIIIFSYQLLSKNRNVKTSTKIYKIIKS